VELKVMKEEERRRLNLGIKAFSFFLIISPRKKEGFLHNLSAIPIKRSFHGMLANLN
jgi:hypothetical protein